MLAQELTAFPVFRKKPALSGIPIDVCCKNEENLPQYPDGTARLLPGAGVWAAAAREHEVREADVRLINHGLVCN